ncbi:MULTISPECIES: NB-ARC domain-containing protein [Streptomyces violaceusniger group]|uniref:NB-ARC domain-containing protein n=1 Tax=Streptomyces violaceusniger group TaxID=2839105 RepID=UPI00142E001D|nr:MULTISPECIES: NB-ARC domain-containing protein [Streptomyces violaceusniger group]
MLGLLLSLVLGRLEERARAGADDPPPPSPPIVPGWVIDRAEAYRVVFAVISRRRRAVGITTALEGAGGFGKTTLAELVCANRGVQRRFRGRVYIITVGREVRGRAAIAAKIGEVTRFVTGDTATFDDPALAGAHLGRLLNQRRRTLLVLDDVWEQEQLEPFLVGGARCVRLVTTRIPALLPSGAKRVHVDEMSPLQARRVLTWELPPVPEAVTQDLLRATGLWPLLLRMTNRLIMAEVDAGADPASAAADTLQRLQEQGPVGVDDPSAVLDLDDPKQRKKAVRATLEAATRLLPAGGSERFVELGVFAEHEAIPVPLVSQLWAVTGGLTATQSRDLCRTLNGLSLLTLSAAGGSQISLHDVIRQYLRSELGSHRLTVLNAALVNSVKANLAPATALTPSAPRPQVAWWEVTIGYLLDHLIDHLLAAGCATEAKALAMDLRWVEARLHHRGAAAPWRDLRRIGATITDERANDLARAAHLLGPTEPAHALSTILHSRLEPLVGWQDQVQARQIQSSYPTLLNRWAPPDIPDPAPLRTLTGVGAVNSVQVAPDGTWLVTISRIRNALHIWDRSSGAMTATLQPGLVRALALAPDGTWLATAGGFRGKVRIWDRATGALSATLNGAGIVRTMAIAPDGAWLATAGNSRKVRIWDRATGALTTTLKGTTAVTAMAIAPDGTWLAAAGLGKAVQLWDKGTNTHTTIKLPGQTGWIRAMAIAPDGTWLAAASEDGIVHICDRPSGTTETLSRHPDQVKTLAIAPQGAWLATISGDHTVQIWDRSTGDLNATFRHEDPVSAVAISPDFTWLATADEETVRLWDLTTGRPTTATDSAGGVNAVAIEPRGRWLVTAHNDRNIRLWPTDTPEPTTCAGHTGPVRALAITSNSREILSGGDDGILRIWHPNVVLDLDNSRRFLDLNTHHGIGAPFSGPADHTGGVMSVAIAPDTTWGASGGKGPALRIWERSGAKILRHTGSVTSVVIEPEGAWVVAATNAGVQIWDRSTGKAVKSLERTFRTSAVAIAPDGTWLATANRKYFYSTESELRIWDTFNWATIKVLKHVGIVSALAIAPDGAWLATASEDGTIRIWNRTSGKVVTIMRTDSHLNACTWTPTGLAVGGERGLYFYGFHPRSAGWNDG